MRFEPAFRRKFLWSGKRFLSDGGTQEELSGKEGPTVGWGTGGQ